MPDHYDSEGYKRNVALGDAEFAQQIAPYLKPEYRHLIDPLAAKLIPMTTAGTMHFPWMGANTRRWTPDETLEYGRVPSWAMRGDAYPPVNDPSTTFGDSKPINLSGGNVYAFGAENARPEVWAHEFRHDAIFDEAENRKEDIRRAFLLNDPRLVKQSTDLWQQWMYRRDGNDMDAYPYRDKVLREIADILATK